MNEKPKSQPPRPELRKTNLRDEILAELRGLASSAVDEGASRVAFRKPGHLRVMENAIFNSKMRRLEQLVAETRGHRVNELRFLTPSGATWEEVEIAVIDREHVRVRVRDVEQRLHYSQMGLGNRKSLKPSVLFVFLLVFCAESGVVTWKSKHANRSNQKSRERLAKVLEVFFGIDGDPFELTSDRKGWQARFHTSWKSGMEPHELLSTFRRSGI